MQSFSPFHDAIKLDDLAGVKALIKNIETFNTDINAEDGDGVTALIEACISGNESIVRLLLESGCPAQPPIGFRHTPLRGAAICGHAHLIPILLEADADPNALSEGQRTPLMGACFLRKTVMDPERKSVECVKALLADKRTDPTIANTFGETALDQAKIRGYNDSKDLIEKLLDDWKLKAKE